MKIIKYTISNYRAIANTEIKLNYSINPIIGVNESGKTTILQAILAFDKNRDKYNGGSHLDYQNKYFTKPTKESRVTAFLRLDKKEIADLLHELQLTSKAKSEFQKIDDNYIFQLSRELSSITKNYSLLNSDFPDLKKSKALKFILNKLPFILYFDDFTDRVPDETIFTEEFLKAGTLSTAKNRDWQEIIIEIFKRALPEGIEDNDNPLKSFFELKDQDKKDDILSDIEDELNQEIIEEWKKVKKSGLTNFADDSENLALELKNEDHTFRFKVRDKSNQDKKRTFNVSDRSKGFQWFFNYMIKLKFNPRYKDTKENSIFLLDEPGSYLHSSAQGELLNELSRVSKSNTIVFCTHSQYLLNPKIIRLGSVKVAEKTKSIITLTEYGNYKGKNDKGALSALYQALHLNFTRDFLGKIVITEGITDMYFFEMLKEHTNCFKNDFKIIPGSGSGNSSNLISIGISFSENFVVLFDNDDGIKAFKKYITEFGEEIKEKYFHVYSTENKFRLESFFSLKDKQEVRRLTKTQDLKKALAILYYDQTSDQKFFFQQLSKDTLESLQNTILRINAL